MSGLPAGGADRIERVFLARRSARPVKLDPARRQKLFDAMRLDKKVSGGEIKFVLARRIGAVELGQPVPW